MKQTTLKILDDALDFYPRLASVKEDMIKLFDLLLAAYKKGNKILLCGNGGSASDSDHLAGEFLKSFRKKRPLSEEMRGKLNAFGEKGAALAAGLEGAVPAISLLSHPAFTTAFNNDVCAEMAFAQQLFALGAPGDVLIAFSTSGNAKNCVNAAIVANSKNIKVAEFSGRDGGALRQYADAAVIVPLKETYLIQEAHCALYHCISAMLEEEIW